MNRLMMNLLTTRVIHICASQLQHLLLEYGVESISEVLVEGLSRVKRCTDEGRALMSLDLQVLIFQFNIWM
jgi:hypothetical protein